MRTVEAARAALEKKDFPAAVTLFQKAAELWPDNTDLAGERDQVVRATVEHAIAKADSEVAQEQYVAALGTLDEILAVLPDREELTKRKTDVTRRWSRRVLEGYEQHALSGEWELAWVAAIQAGAVALPNNPQNVQNLNRAEEKIRQSISYRLGIVSMKTPMVPPEVGSAVCKALAEDVGKSKPSHVHLVDSLRPTSAIEESDLAPASASQPETQPADGVLAGKLPDTDLALLIDVIANRADSKQPGQPGASKFLAGRKNVQNTAYATAEVTLREARKALGQARSDAQLNEKTWDLAGRRALASEQTFAERAATGYYGNKAKDAADQYAAAVKALDQIPQWTQVDDWQEHQYPVHQVTRDVEVKVRMRLVEVATAKVVWQDNQTTSRASHADTQIDGDAVRNVTAKAANLKDSRELIAEAVDKVLPTLRAKARSLLAHRAGQFMEQARLVSGDARVVSYVRFLFDSGAECNEKDATTAFGEIFKAQGSESGIEACKRVAMERLNMRFRVPTEPGAPLLAEGTSTALSAAQPAGIAAGQSAVRPALPGDVIASSGRQPREIPVAQSRPAGQPPTVAQWPGQVREPPSPIARADQQRSRQTPPTGKSAKDQRKTTAAPGTTQMKPAPAVPVPLPPPSDRAADIAGGRVYQGVISRDDKRYKKEVLTVDGIIIKLKDTGSKPLDADVEVTVGKTSTRKNDLPIGTRMLIRGASGRRYDFAITAIDYKTETLWFTMQQTTLESLPR